MVTPEQKGLTLHCGVLKQGGTQWDALGHRRGAAAGPISPPRKPEQEAEVCGQNPHQLLHLQMSSQGSCLCSQRAQRQRCPLHSPARPFPSSPTTAELPCPSRHVSARKSTLSNHISGYSTTKWPMLRQGATSQWIREGSPRIVSSWFLFLFKRNSGEVLLLGGGKNCAALMHISLRWYNLHLNWFMSMHIEVCSSLTKPIKNLMLA